jgi:protein-tyrosine phosphatase
MTPDQILPNLFVGSCPQDVEDIDRLKRDFSITAVLSLQTDHDLLSWRIRWDKMRASYKRMGIEIRRVPVRDFDPDELRRLLPECVRVLDELLQAGHTVYLHCNAAVNRSPTVAIAYLHWIKGMTLEEATDHVMQRHSCEPYVEAIWLAEEDRQQNSP